MVFGGGPGVKVGTLGSSPLASLTSPRVALSSSVDTNAEIVAFVGGPGRLDLGPRLVHSRPVQLHLIDGTYELFRSHFGAPPAIDADGRAIGATRGLLRSMLALLREPGTTHIAIAFDQVIESFRNALFDGYKTGEGMDPELWAQFPLAERVAEALGMVVWPMVEFEADDALATAAHRWADAPGVERVLLCSPDKDLGQCVRGEKVVLFDRRRREIYDAAGIREKFGVEPRSIPDLLALVGDKADGIPGISRWGMKSTAAVLSVYGHIEAIPDDPSDWALKVRGAKSLATNLAAARAEARLYRTLAVLRTDVPLPQTDLDALRWRGARRDLLEPLCAELGDLRALDRVPAWAD